MVEDYLVVMKRLHAASVITSWLITFSYLYFQILYNSVSSPLCKTGEIQPAGQAC